MSSTLFWEPTVRQRPSLSDDLKFKLRIRYGESVSAVLDHTDLEYLRGLQDAGVPEVQKLIEAIEKHDSITLTEEW